MTLVVAGSETTTFLIGNLLHAMAREPAITERMRSDRTLVNVFVEEAMRVDGPPQRLFRIATRDVEVGGKLIRKGDWVALFSALPIVTPRCSVTPTSSTSIGPTSASSCRWGTVCTSASVHHWPAWKWSPW